RNKRAISIDYYRVIAFSPCFHPYRAPHADSAISGETAVVTVDAHQHIMPSSLFTPPICFLPSHSASHHEVAQKNLRATNARRAPSPRSLANHDQLTHVNGKDWLLRRLGRTKRGSKDDGLQNLP